MQIKSNMRLLKLYNQLSKINDQRHIYSIRTAFLSAMPIIIVGAYAVVINQLPIPAYQQFMLDFFGDQWHVFGGLAFNATTQIVTLVVTFLICSNLAEWYNSNHSKQVHGGICGIVGLASYLVVSLPLMGADSLPFNIVGVNGLFIALIVSIVAGEAMVRLSGKENRLQLLSDDPSMLVPQAFASVVPAIFIVGGFLVLRILLVRFGIVEGLPHLVNDLLSKPFKGGSNSIGTGVLYSISSHLMWLFGIHGNNVLDGVAQTVFVPANEVNAAMLAAGLTPPNLITKTFFDVFVYMGGSGTTLALLISLFIFGRKQGQQSLLKFAVPNSIFNINEPLIFGVPIVLNPYYAIPFVFTPVLMFFTTAFAMKVGLVPYTGVDVSWATPVFISGYIATGSFSGVLLQLVNLVLAVLVYAPFVKLSDKMADIRFGLAYHQLLKVVTSEYVDSTTGIIDRVDEIGAAARQLSNQLDIAMSNGEMHLKYQPIMDVEGHKINSVEALLRWDHPKHGSINPMVAIVLAEETKRISKLGLWILEEAVAQRAQWTKDGLGDFYISVNISTKQLTDSDFHENVLGILDIHGVPASQLQVEITEAAALVESTATSVNLDSLHRAGVTIAMDDFGVGHSSLLYLRTQPITTLKIDGSLSRNVLENQANLDIIATIYDLCQLLNVKTVVEYVDNKAQLEKLMDIGTFLIQGYFYSPPILGCEIPKFITDYKTEGMEQVGDYHDQ